MRLQDKVAVVTGGAGGIGWIVAKALAAEGASVVLGDISKAGAARAAAAICEQGGSALGRRVDVSVRQEVEALADASAEAEFGVASVAFCSAGITTAGGDTNLLELTDEEWDRVMDVNLRGTFLTSQVVARRLVAQSCRDRSSPSRASARSARCWVRRPITRARPGVSGFTRALAINLAPYGIQAQRKSAGLHPTRRRRRPSLTRSARRRSCSAAFRCGDWERQATSPVRQSSWRVTSPPTSRARCLVSTAARSCWGGLRQNPDPQPGGSRGAD